MLSVLSKVWDVALKFVGKSSTRAAELEAEKDLLETKAFMKGRYSPKYLAKYSVVGIVWVFVILFVGHILFPAHIQDPTVWLGALMASISDALALVWKGL